MGAEFPLIRVDSTVAAFICSRRPCALLFGPISSGRGRIYLLWVVFPLLGSKTVMLGASFLGWGVPFYCWAEFCSSGCVLEQGDEFPIDWLSYFKSWPSSG